MDTINVPFAHTIDPTSLELGILRDEIDPEVWDAMYEVFEALAHIQHPAGGGASFYVVFDAPFDRSRIRLMHADQLYARYETKFYNEEIHLITPKQ